LTENSQEGTSLLNETMCCRFYTDDETKKDILGTVSKYDRRIDWLREGDVAPSDPATVITGETPGLYARDMHWGFPSRNGELLINARVETAGEKKSFSESLEERRCVIPAKGFYEWDRDKHKAKLTDPEGKQLYLAGLYKEFEDGAHFTVLTTNANESMKPIHDRMPLLLEKDQITAWIENKEKTDSLLAQEPGKLKAYREYEQLSLFDL